MRSLDTRTRSPWGTLAVLALAQFMVVLDVTIVNVALPNLQASLHFSPDDLQWVISAYTLAFGGFLLLGGRLSDLLGRRRIFTAGLALFSVASLAGGLASSQGVLIGVRAVQGFGGALMSAAALSILTVTFAQGRQRNIAMGIWGGLAGLGGTLGVVAGGILVDALGWEWVFFVNVPIGLLLLAVTPRYVPRRVEGPAPGPSTSPGPCSGRPVCWRSSSGSSGPNRWAGAPSRCSARWPPASRCWPPSWPSRRARPTRSCR